MNLVVLVTDLGVDEVLNTDTIVRISPHSIGQAKIDLMDGSSSIINASQLQVVRILGYDAEMTNAGRPRISK